MKKLMATLISISSLSVWANCADLSGTYRIQDVAQDCVVKQTDGTLMVYADAPAVLLMASPGANYGHFLNGLVINGLDQIEVTQNKCSSLNIASMSDSSKSLKLEVGHIPYFGARSPVFADSSLDELGLNQSMLITKFTVISNGEQVIYTDLKYTSSLTLDENQNLIAQASIKYGKKDKKSESVSCKFSKI